MAVPLAPMPPHATAQMAAAALTSGQSPLKEAAVHEAEPATPLVQVEETPETPVALSKEYYESKAQYICTTSFLSINSNVNVT